jgi:predicted outer membrane repeat protein
MRTAILVVLAAVVLAGVSRPAPAAIHVPDDQPTIQGGIEAASAGDTVVVSCGTYYEHDVTMKQGVTLLSETGLADCVTIDAEGLGHVLICDDVGDYDDPDLVEGFTFVHGSATAGGGVYCRPICYMTFRNCAFRWNTASDVGGGLSTDANPLTFEHCVFEGNSAGSGGGMGLLVATATMLDCRFEGNSAEHGAGIACACRGTAVASECSFIGNTATDHGGGISCSSEGDVDLEDCLFAENSAGTSGGALYCLSEYDASQARIVRCTLVGNEAGEHGGGIYCDGASIVSLTKTIISFSTGEALYCDDASSTVGLLCCDLYGNTGGDWVGCVAGQSGAVGNCSCDPLFCLEDNPLQPYSLHEGSPCICEPCSPCGDYLGAFGPAAGCDPVSLVGRSSWGAIKAMFR